MNSRFKNYGFWTAIISSAFILLQAFGIKINAPYVNEIITAILGVLVVLGIINNPTDGSGFGDSKTIGIGQNNEISVDENSEKNN